ncbi:RidA family protein [Cystobacter fuscus]|uniref:RidA family protein n=1 Tax=Cystobacter fuscus TaxID=43 RepID=UPI002B300EDE|nr:RidA family protein [Cystobacter fuscus]
MHRTAILAFTLLASACASNPTRPTLEFIPDAPPLGPFSRAVRAGDLLFLSGQIGIDSSGQLVSGGIEAETRQCLENIRAILARSGLGMDRIAKCTVFLTDMSEWKAMNEVYVTFFPGPKPARSALGTGTNGLALNARVEIECIAAAK